MVLLNSRLATGLLAAIAMLASSALEGGDSSANIIRNPEFQGDGLGGLLNWNLSGDAEVVRGIGPGGQSALRLTSRNGRSLNQRAIWLVPGEKYRFGAWVRTKGVKPNSIRLIVYNANWIEAVSAGWLPSDTGGEWRKMEWCGAMLDRPAHNFALYQDHPIEGGVVEICAPYLEALSERGVAKSRPAPLDVPRPARIVPIDPKLSKLDANSASVEFYYPGDLDSSPGEYVVSARIDGLEAVSARLDDRCRARIDFGAVAAGRHELTVSVLEAKSGRVVATNRYPVVAAVRNHGAGKRLNNFVVELLRTAAKDGEYVFELPDDGWVYISLDGAGRSAEARLDGGAKAVVRYRVNEPMDAMRYLPAGRHVVTLSGAAGGELRVNAVRPLLICPGERVERTRLDRFLFGRDFYRRYIYHTFNTSQEFSFQELGVEHEEYGMVSGGEMRVPEPSPVWGSLEALSAAVTNFVSFRKGFDLAIDESSPVVPRLNQWTLAETCWPLAAGRQSLSVWWNNCHRNVCNDPKGQASMLAAIANSGGGRGWILPETYLVAYPDKERALAQERQFGNLLESVRKQVPCAGNAVVFCFGGYLTPTGWCGYSAPETDMKVVFDSFIRNMAVSGAFRGVGGLGLTSIHKVDEELLRWILRCIRHYALRGETCSLSDRYGFKFRPGHLANCDFTAGFAHWTPCPAEEGGLSITNIPGFGVRFKGRKMISPGPGDSLAVFRRSAKAPNRLSQKVTGLEPGRLYSFSCFSADPSDIAKPGPQGREIGMRLSADSGAVEVPELAYTFACPQNRLPDGRDKWSKRPVPLRVVHRIVFRATGPEAVLSISDWSSPDAPGGEIGGRRIVNYCILRPYYIVGERELDALKSMYRR